MVRAVVNIQDSFLGQLLNLHWLRPETALWRTFDCMLMDRYGDIHGLSADFGCGDGTMSYIMAGGRVSDDYDVFMEITNLSDYNSGADIHNQIVASSLTLNSNNLKHKFDWGIDHKEGLVSKAKRYGDFYKQTSVQDLNLPLALPDGSLHSAFSNILYWLEDIDRVLTEWRRLLGLGGKLNLFLPSASFKDKAWLYYSAPHVGRNRYLNYFDRGYGELIHHCLNSSEWNKIFERNRWEISEHKLYLSDPVMDIWNVGTRPIAPLLIEMTNKLSPLNRLEIKGQWISYFKNFFSPILDGELDRNLTESEAGFHFFVLEGV